MQAQGKQQALHAVLTGQVHCTELLLDCLTTERSALARRDMDTVQQTTAEKLRLSQELETLEQRRERLVAELGFGAGNRRPGKWHDSLPACKRLWKQVLDNLENCRNSNLTNGGILEASRQHVEQALCILRGQSGAATLYSQDGDAAADLGRRELGKV
jgi:flagellar biosynthesis/type III secretory pathway chaperone